ncbi:hypothetical protein GIB67_016021 [Kingdonia uniflora]|uniref:DUF4283 domain-containing protein n=1 Tax=Kingdonia uniflora TaxID=39325 RepID=A0A7J7L1R7_9MAGN|nr:hypothetical protein GIB67_016021 [Kingdonia uniflora]
MTRVSGNKPNLNSDDAQRVVEAYNMDVGQGTKICYPWRFMGEEKKLVAPGKSKEGITYELEVTQQQLEEQVMENLSLHGKIPDKVTNITKPTQSYVDLVRGSKDILNELLEVGRRGDTSLVSIPAGEAAIGVSQFKYSLIDRLDLQKVKFTDVQEYARNKWKISGQYKLIPLGKGFFIIKLGNKNDKIFIWSHGPWIVEKMPMRLMP